jgi:hypothetical protein
MNIPPFNNTQRFFGFILASIILIASIFRENVSILGLIFFSLLILQCFNGIDIHLWRRKGFRTIIKWIGIIGSTLLVISIAISFFVELNKKSLRPPQDLFEKYPSGFVPDKQSGFVPDKPIRLSDIPDNTSGQ